MKKNVGASDRALRIVAAVVVGLLLALGYVSGVLGTVLGVVAILLLATSFVSFCPLYALLRVSSRKETAPQAR